MFKTYQFIEYQQMNWQFCWQISSAQRLSCVTLRYNSIHTILCTYNFVITLQSGNLFAQYLQYQKSTMVMAMKIEFGKSYKNAIGIGIFISIRKVIFPRVERS